MAISASEALHRYKHTEKCRQAVQNINYTNCDYTIILFQLQLSQKPQHCSFNLTVFWKNKRHIYEKSCDGGNKSLKKLGNTCHDWLRKGQTKHSYFENNCILFWLHFFYPVSRILFVCMFSANEEFQRFERHQKYSYWFPAEIWCGLRIVSLQYDNGASLTHATTAADLVHLLGLSRL